MYMKEMHKVWLATGTKKVYLEPGMANRHGLIAGATGTGKTVTLKVLAESFSDMGVPVFLADIKGDLSGMVNMGVETKHILRSIDSMKIENFDYTAYPVRFWPGIVKLKEMVDSGEYGQMFQMSIWTEQLTGLNSSVLNKRRWGRTACLGGGQLFNWGPHIVDQSLRLLGAPVKEQFSHCVHAVAGGDCEDHFTAHFIGENGEDVTFPQLLRRVAQHAPQTRIRFTTSHPKDMSDDTLRVIAEEPNVCKSIHLPVQSGSNTMLKAMNRKYTREWYLDRIAAIRRIIPDAAIGTDVFCGFHDESIDDHQETLSLMREVGFDTAFMFKYSERPGTHAQKHLPDNISEEEKVRRLNEIIALQNQLSLESNQREIGKVVEVLVEGYSKRSREDMYGRTSQYKTVVFPREGRKIGEFVLVKIEEASAATLKGKIV